MASKPGILSEWPWASLGNFKYMILAPWGIHSIYLYMTKGEEADFSYLFFLPFLLSRILHDQLWISLSRYRTAKGNNLIVDKGIDFEQVDRERNWDDQIILNGIILYIVYWAYDNAKHLPLWRTDGIIMVALIHVGPVEFLYYWLHRALHHHFLYSRYHSHHHSSIVTEPITSVVHPFAEHMAYFILFAMPLLATLHTGTLSLMALSGYITFIDFMNNMGHCNFELIPKRLFSIFPPLKYLMYTPSYHSLHHTQFQTNYSLFMPFYDYIYGTMDKSSDALYVTSLKKPEQSPDAVYLTHLTSPQSIYHLRLGFASLASKPLCSKWYLWLMWPITLWSMILAKICGRTFIVERNTFDNLRMQSWSIPRYTLHYLSQRQRAAINDMVEEAILEANDKNVKVLTLGLLNQGEEFNRNGEIYVQKFPNLKMKLVDGSSLAVAVILNSIPKGTTQVLFRGRLSKIAYAVVITLCQKGIQVVTIREDEYQKLKMAMAPEHSNKLVPSNSTTGYNTKTWVVGEDVTKSEQSTASKGTTFIPFSQFPPTNTRKDCSYLDTPAMLVPSSLGNLHTCENWLMRKAMSAWRIAGIVHALEGWSVHECGDSMFNVDKVWQASLHHGFRPLPSPT